MINRKNRCLIPIHKEGIPTLVIAGLFVIAVSLIVLLTALPHWLAIALIAGSLVLFVFIFQFFRFPLRQLTTDDNLLIAPADGEVVVIEQTLEKEFIGGQTIQISIFMSPLNVHINWFPTSGVITGSRYHPGKYLVAWHPKSSSENERHSTAITRSDSTTVVVAQIAGAVARRVVCYAKEGGLAALGEQLGYIKFGSRVDVFVPNASEILVKIGESVKGGVTPLVRLKK